MSKSRAKKFILNFDEISIKDVPLVGGKTASLGEMYGSLTKKGVKIPNGFAITAAAYFYLLKKTGAGKKIEETLKGLKTGNLKDLAKRGAAVRKIILQAELPPELAQEIIKSYRALSKLSKVKDLDVAVRSSATAEDLPDASFAGQQETFLNVRGEKALLLACKKCFASLFTNRAISYRQDKGFGHLKIGLSIAVQKMVRSDLSSSGIMFSIDTESGFKDVVLIEGSWGLGENIVQGQVNPDTFYVFKPTLAQGYQAIISKKLGTKKIRMVYKESKAGGTKNLDTSSEDQNRYIISDREILQLARWAVVIENHYSKKAGHFKPMDMEWAKDGRTGELFIVQARPETVQALRDLSVLEEYKVLGKGKVLVTGQAVGAKVGQGHARVIRGVKEIGQFREGEVLVTTMTDPDWEPIMKKARAIVTDLGGRTSHAAIVSRELGVPAIVGTNRATKAIKTGQSITVSCAEGQEGLVYSGLIPFKVKKTNLKNLKRPKTRLEMIMGTPEEAFKSAQIPNDGVGLARLEFIFTSYIKVHPLALLNFNKLKDQAVKNEITALTKAYPSKKEYFIQRLSAGIAMLAAAFYPKEVIVRFSDFKSNEYANLVGGRQFEPKEENPMLGFRGASRYYAPQFREAFELECLAIKRVREKMGLKNVKVMIPFCRTTEEAKKVLAVMKENGLVQGQGGLEVFVMIEIPANVILGQEFAKIFDGFSIGSNDLAQLTLGLDRDSAIVSKIGNENNPAVKELVARIIKIARQNKIKIGFCGQAPSDFPDFTRFLVKEGIDSISLNPDTVIKTTLAVLKEERA